MKKIVSLLLLIAMICSLAACSSNTTADKQSSTTSTQENVETADNTESQTKEPPVFYYVGPRTGGLAWNQSKLGFDDAIAELGIEGYFIAPTTPFNNSEILELVSTAQTSGADIILGAFSDPDLYGTVIKDLQADGIIVAALGNYAEGPDIVVAPSYTVMGERFCAELDELADPSVELNILMLHTAAGVKTTEVNAAVEAYCATRGNAKIVDTQFVGGDAIQGADVTASALRAYPEINAIIATDATGGLGCGTYVGENNLGDDLIVIVEANSGDCINAVLAGSIDKLVNWEYYDMGYQATKNAVAFYYGENIESVSAPEPSIISIDNAADYAAEHDIDLG